MIDIVGRSFGSTTVATKTETGDWTVVVNMVESRKLDGQDWEEKKISTQCTNSSFADAYKVALEATLGQFQKELAITKSDSLFPELTDTEV